MKKNKIIPILLSLYIIALTIPINGEQINASINFQGEKTDVYLKDDIIIRLSIINLISNPKMYAQVIILPPSGMSVTSSDFSKITAGQFATNYELDPGDGKDIEIKMRSNQVGDFNVKGKVIYYFGEEKDKVQKYEEDLPIKVRRDTVLTISKESTQGYNKGMIGFEIILIGVGIIAIVIIISMVLIYMLKR